MVLITCLSVEENSIVIWRDLNWHHEGERQCSWNQAFVARVRAGSGGGSPFPLCPEAFPGRMSSPRDSSSSSCTKAAIWFWRTGYRSRWASAQSVMLNHTWCLHREGSGKRPHHWDPGLWLWRQNMAVLQGAFREPGSPARQINLLVLTLNALWKFTGCRKREENPSGSTVSLPGTSEGMKVNVKSWQEEKV